MRSVQHVAQVSKEPPNSGLLKSIDAPVRPEWFTQSREQAPSAATSSQSGQHSQQGSDAGEESHNDGIERSDMAMEASIACAASGLRLTSRANTIPWSQQAFIGERSDNSRRTTIGKILRLSNLPECPLLAISGHSVRLRQD